MYTNYNELNATTQAQFYSKLKKLLKLIEKGKQQLPEINSFEAYFKFIEDFEKEAKVTRPLSIIYNKKYKQPSAEHLELLKNYNYPADYIEWATKYGQCYLRIESTTITSLDSVIDSVDEDYYEMITRNNYLYFTDDGGGNFFVFDLNEPEFTIRLFDHNSYITEDNIEEIYSEELGFYTDGKSGQLVNPNGLDSTKIFDAEGNYILNSVYISQYLKNPDVSEVIDANGFLPFLILKTLQGFDEIIHRYRDNIIEMDKPAGVKGFEELFPLSNIPPRKNATDLVRVRRRAERNTLDKDTAAAMYSEHLLFINSGGYYGHFERLDANGIPLNLFIADAAEGKHFECGYTTVAADVNFKNLNLTKSNFSTSICEGVDFSGANLSGAFFTDGFYANANFEGADLRDADFTGADLRGANFRNADITGTDFEIANCDGADFTGCATDAGIFKGTSLNEIVYTIANQNLFNRDIIIEKLSSSSLNDFAEGIQLANKGYSINKAALAMDQEIMERVTSVLAYEKYHTHDELSDIIDKAMELMPEHITMMGDLFNRYTFRGIYIFIDQFINHSKADLSGFFNPAPDFPYMIVSSGCKNMAKLIEENDKEGAEVMIAFSEVLDTIFKAQLEARSLLYNFKEWDKPTATAVHNVLVAGDMHSKQGLLNILKGHEGNEALLEYGIDPYAETLAGLKDQYVAEGNTEKAFSLIFGYIAPIVRYIKTTKRWGKMPDRMKLMWDMLELACLKDNPDIATTFNSPAPQQEWQDLEKITGVTLPEELREFYFVHNGQDTGKVLNSGVLTEGTEGIFPVSKIIQEWNLWNSLSKEFGDNEIKLDDVYRVKPLYWSPLWIPLAGNGNGDVYFMDFDPTKDGIYKQIILRKHNGPQYSFIASSFEDWIERFIDQKQQVE